MTEKETTTVTHEEFNIDDLLGQPSATSVITQTEKKPNIFSQPEGAKFLDNIDNEGLTEEEKTAKALADRATGDDIKKGAAILDDMAPEEVDETAVKPVGRAKTDKSGLVEFAKKMIEDKEWTGFDDDKSIDDYTLTDFQDLYKANIAERDKKLQEEIPAQFFDSLPEQLQYAAKYVADGGTDLKGLFKVLAHAEEVANLDITTEEGQEATVRQFLYATSYGTPEEIEEEIKGLQDRSELEKKAIQHKPKLDAMQAKVVEGQLKNQEALRKKQEAASQQYQKSIYDTLKPAELNGLKIDKKVQGMLYNGLTEANYQSVNGQQTNLLGHLLEKHQFVEPNHALIAEALWLLADPDAYRTKVREDGEKKAVEKTVRQLKTAEANKNGGAHVDEETVGKNRGAGKIARPMKNVFSRE